ncbi:MAG: hypothetical protein Q4C00_05685 [Bacillota bacterium]|nr:hypothetical protein [Bacillota bacterium]
MEPTAGIKCLVPFSVVDSKTLMFVLWLSEGKHQGLFIEERNLFWRNVNEG